MLETIVSLILLLNSAGYSEKDIKCTVSLVQKESNFNLHSRNSTTGAYGLFQIMRIEKKTFLSLKEQVSRFDRYIEHRYQGSPCLALKHFKAKNWYQVRIGRYWNLSCVFGEKCTYSTIWRIPAHMCYVKKVRQIEVMELLLMSNQCKQNIENIRH